MGFLLVGLTTVVIKANKTRNSLHSYGVAHLGVRPKKQTVQQGSIQIPRCLATRSATIRLTCRWSEQYERHSRDCKSSMGPV